MVKSKIIKAMTLILFFTSLSAFVAYRGGYISLTKLTAISDEEVVSQDSIPVRLDSLVDKTWMYSSKSIILSNPIKMSDSLRRAQSRKKILMMSGSKSGAVFVPDSIQIFVLDSIQMDSIKQRPIKKKK